MLSLWIFWLPLQPEPEQDNKRYTAFLPRTVSQGDML